MYDKAKALINEQKYDEALKVLKKHFRNTSDLDVLFHFGKTYYYLKKYNLAYKCFVKSQKISETNLSQYSMFYMANILVYQKKFTKALDILFYLEKIKSDIDLNQIFDLLLKQFAIYYQRYNFHKKYFSVINIFEKYIMNINNISSDLYNIFFTEYDKAIYMLSEKYSKKKQYSKLAKFYLKNYFVAQKYKLNISNKMLSSFFKIIIIIQQKNLKISSVLSVQRAIKIYEKYKKMAELLDDINIKKDFINISFENIVRLAQIYNQKIKYSKTKQVYNKYSYLCEKDDFLGNKFLNEYEIATKQVVLKSKPRRYLIAVSNICDLKCIMCFQNKDKKKRYSLCTNFFNIFCKNLKYAERIIWQGGEPIIFPFFPKLLRECQKYPRIHNILVSNFQNVKEELFELLVNSNLDLTISIDGANKKTYEKIRVGAKFDKLIKNIKKLQATAKKFSKTLFMNINFVIIKENYKEMLDIFNFAVKYNFRQISFIGGHMEDPSKNLSDEEKKVVKKQFVEIKKLARKYGIKVDDRLYFPPKKLIEKKDVYLDVLKNKNSQNRYTANNVPVDMKEYKKIIKVETKVLDFVEIDKQNLEQQIRKDVEQESKIQKEEEIKKRVEEEVEQKSLEKIENKNLGQEEKKEAEQVIRKEVEQVVRKEVEQKFQQKIEQITEQKVKVKIEQKIEQNLAEQQLKKQKEKKQKNKYSKNIFCHLPWNELTVQYDNLILPHCICNVGQKIDLTKIKDINDIWNSEVAINYRLKMLYNDVALCSGQCLVQHVIRNKEYHKPVINV